MKNYVAILTIFLIFFGCETKHKSHAGSKIWIESIHYHLGDTIKMNYQKFDSIFVFNTKIEKIVLNSSHNNLGTNQLKITAYKDGKSFESNTKFHIFSNIQEKISKAKIVKSYPHNAEFFTQGLEFNSGFLYESSGLYKKSKIVRYKLGETQPEISQNFDNEYFAEGITILKNKIYVLTWKEKVIFELNKNDLKVDRHIDLPEIIQEGWGIANDGEYFYISNGTEKIFKLNSDFELLETIQIVGYENFYSELNELEFNNGFLYANVWQKSIVLKINPATGEVIQVKDLEEFTTSQKIKGGEVLNGITFLPNNNLLFTGKNWSNLYEVN